MILRHKYRVAPKEDRTLDGVVFDSKREMERWVELKHLEKAGEIKALARQLKFKIVVNGVQICTYKPDFAYLEGDKKVMEDLKGFETPVFKLKWKLVKALYPEFTWRITK